MTTFDSADIPADVVTIEQLHAWTGSILELNAGSDSYPETVAGNEYEFSIKKGRAFDGSLRMIIRSSFVLVEDHQTRPVWKQVEEDKQGTIPANFKVAEA